MVQVGPLWSQESPQADERGSGGQSDVTWEGLDPPLLALWVQEGGGPQPRNVGGL